ncbi:MAG: helix-turn-helix domain-containing protein [Candidatus Zixiibacteriota bacterium]
MEKLLTPQEIAEVLGVQPSTIYQWTHQGYIPHIKLGKLLRFRQSDVLEWLDRISSPGRKTRKFEIKEIVS